MASNINPNEQCTNCRISIGHMKSKKPNRKYPYPKTRNSINETPSINAIAPNNIHPKVKSNEKWLHKEQLKFLWKA
jgi:hypothetical protein